MVNKEKVLGLGLAETVKYNFFLGHLQPSCCMKRGVTMEGGGSTGMINHFLFSYFPLENSMKISKQVQYTNNTLTTVATTMAEKRDALKKRFCVSHKIESRLNPDFK